ncbi:MAG: winged helix-turn-helix domain-containing protein [Candidatus Atabeyarchaeum deiterrae]
MFVGSERILDNRNMTIPVEEILSSRGRIRIIKMLLKNDELCISEIVRLTRLNHNSVVQHLDLLKHAGFVYEKKFGRIRIYSIRNESLIVKAMKSFISLWGFSKMEIHK